MMLRQILSVAAGAMLLSAPVLMSGSNVQAAPAGNRMERSAQWKQFQKDLNLTDVQKAQLKQIRTETRTQMEGVLNDSQKAQLKTMKESRGQANRQKGGWKQLGLTSAQKDQLKKIRESAKTRSELVYTQVQKDLIKKHRSERKAKSTGTTWNSTDPMNVR